MSVLHNSGSAMASLPDECRRSQDLAAGLLAARSTAMPGINRLDPISEHRPISPDLRRSGSYSVPFASAWRKRGRSWSPKGSTFPPQPLPSDRGGRLAQPPSADVRVGSRRRRAEAGRHRARGVGCRVVSHHPRPPSLPSPLFLQAATRVVLMEGVSSERYLHANVARFGQQSALRKPGASRVDR